MSLLPVRAAVGPALVLLVGVYCSLGLGQTPAPAILQIDVENHVRYHEDISDVSKLATDAGVTSASPPRNFGKFVDISDIVAVNGQPARGTIVRNLRTTSLRTAPNPGEAIAD